jgi:valyl-tRNA synthetase
LIEIVRAIRTARQEAGVEPGRWIAAKIAAGPFAGEFEGARQELATLARVADDQLSIVATDDGAKRQALTVVAGEVVATLPLAGLVDLDVERARLGKELATVEADRDRAQAQLANEAFTARAPAHVVEAQRRRLAQTVEQFDLLRRRLDELGG